MKIDSAFLPLDIVQRYHTLVKDSNIAHKVLLVTFSFNSVIFLYTFEVF